MLAGRLVVDPSALKRRVELGSVCRHSACVVAWVHRPRLGTSDVLKDWHLVCVWVGLGVLGSSTCSDRCRMGVV